MLFSTVLVLGECITCSNIRTKAENLNPIRGLTGNPKRGQSKVQRISTLWSGSRPAGHAPRGRRAAAERPRSRCECGAGRQPWMVGLAPLSAAVYSTAYPASDCCSTSPGAETVRSRTTVMHDRAEGGNPRTRVRVSFQARSLLQS
jgi:hypothetical protein